MAVIFEDNTIVIISRLQQNIESVLDECAGEIESATKRNCRVKTGQTKNSWQHVVTSSEDEIIAVIGSDYQNAIWEEFGTGEYAANGDGRKGGWSYKDERGDWHHTKGKTPTHAFQRAYDGLKNIIIKHLEDVFGKGIFE